jgi:hypothetical protein
MRAPLRFAAVALLVLAPAAVAAAQDAAAPSAAAATADAAPDDAATARRRWDAKSPEERELLHRRFAELQALDDEERRALEDVARELKAREEEVRASLPGAVRARLDALPATERQRVFREHVRDLLRREGESVRERLPAGVLAELEALPPPRRPLRLERVIRGDRPMTPHAVRRIGEALGVARPELAELDGLGAAELEDRALRFQRERIDRQVRALGPPPGLDARGYAALAGLPHREFYRSWRALDPPEVYAEPPGAVDAPDSAAGDPAAAGADDPRLAAEPDGLPERGEPPFALARRRAALVGQALALLEPSIAERIELAELDPEARAGALVARARERCLAFVAEHGLLAPAEHAALCAEEGRAFERLAHRTLRAQRRALFGERPRPFERLRKTRDHRR